MVLGGLRRAGLGSPPLTPPPSGGGDVGFGFFGFAGVGMGPREASAAVLRDGLDILVDMDGYSNEGLRRSELFAVRHAPVTMAW